MAYDLEEMENRALKILEEDPDVFFVEDLVALLGVSKSWFYGQKMHELDGIKKGLATNNIRRRKALRKAWAGPMAAPALQMGLYKLLATEDERRRLATTYQEVEKKNSDQEEDLDYSLLTEEELDQLEALYDKARRPDDANAEA